MNLTKKIIYIVVIAALLIAFGVSAFFVVDYLIEGKQQQDLYDQLASMKGETQTERATTPVTQSSQPPAQDETTPPQTTEATEPGILEAYQELYEMNPHMVGWIKIDGTKLDYPVMQTPDEVDYYLYRDFEKNDSKRGSIYAREVCDVNEPSDNITIYGHNMADGSMFAALNSYTRKETWENNSLIFFDTLTEYHTYKIFAVFKTSANLGEGFSYHQFVDAESEAEFDEFVQTCKNLSFYDTGVTPKYGDKMICLSTCEYSLNNGRLVVAAVRIA